MERHAHLSKIVLSTAERWRVPKVIQQRILENYNNVYEPFIVFTGRRDGNGRKEKEL